MCVCASVCAWGDGHFARLRKDEENRNKERKRRSGGGTGEEEPPFFENDSHF